MRGGETTSLRIIAIGGGQEKNTELIREFAGQVSGQDKKNIDNSRTERRLAPFPTPRTYLNSSSLSRTLFSSFINIVFRRGKSSTGVLWAVTRAG
jgi:hypothetical protein